MALAQTLTQAITRINNLLRGTDDDPPAFGTDDWNYWVEVLNRKKNELYTNIAALWSEIHETRLISTISAADEPSIDMDSDFLAPSKKVFIKTPSGQRYFYDVVKPEEATPGKAREVYFEGVNPITLFFSKEILADEQIVGGSLYVPGYYLPKDISRANDKLPVSDGDWLCTATASDIAFNDIVYETKAPDLDAKADKLWRQMTQRNRRGVHGEPRTTPTVVKRISAPSRRR